MKRAAAMRPSTERGSTLDSSIRPNRSLFFSFRGLGLDASTKLFRIARVDRLK